MCIRSNSAVLPLTEYHIKHRNRHHTAVYQFTENIPRSHTGQLVHITNQHNSGPFVNVPVKHSGQPHVHHRLFIQYNKICLQVSKFRFKILNIP